MLAMFLLVLALVSSLGNGKTITYDSRSLIIDGNRVLLMSGGMHYARGTPLTWDHVFQEAAEMNLNTIQTYFMWNFHEPDSKGTITWSNSANLTSFLSMAQKHGLYVVLRIGPYVCGEWNYGGFPWWLRDIPGIDFRTYNQPFINEMGRILKIVVDKVRPYLVTNGGPVILMQVENEYVYHPNKAMGEKYVEWAVKYAESLLPVSERVPWIMCEHNPQMNTSTAINTINGFWDEFNKKGTSWPGPRWINEHVQAFPNQPLFWTEDQGWFNQWRGGPLVRDVRHIANGVLRWYALGGSYHNFYMMYGGNNFARTAGRLATTAYAPDTVITPYGKRNRPKYTVLSKMFGVLKQFGKSMVDQKKVPTPTKINVNVEMIQYQSIIFVSNLGPSFEKVSVGGVTIDLTGNSTVVLDAKFKVLFNSSELDSGVERFPDCKNLDQPVQHVVVPSTWEFWPETPGIGGSNGIQSKFPTEMWNLTHDKTEYIWYVPNGISFDAGSWTINCPNCNTAGTSQYMYIYDLKTKKLIDQSFFGNFLKFTLTQNVQSIGFLIAAFGMSNGGYDSQTYTKGLTGNVTLKRNNKVMSPQSWTNVPYLKGESLGLFEKQNENKVNWNAAANGIGKPLTWWKSSFVMPTAFQKDTFYSLAFDMIGGTKGFVYVNGHNLGRYFMIPSACGSSHYPMKLDEEYCQKKWPLQRFYSVPPDWLRFEGQENYVVVLEEIGLMKPKSLGLVVCDDV